MGGCAALINTLINTHHEEVATVDNWQSHLKTEVAQLQLQLDLIYMLSLEVLGAC